MIFYYLGRPRLTLWFDSPNHCATIAAMLLLVLIGIAAKCVTYTACRTWKFGIFSVLITGLTLVLLLTYSRGGWVAYIAGLVFLASCVARLRAMCLFCALGFAVGMALIPEGMDRAESIADREDRSITNRVEVWKGALAMTADHPLTGVGVDKFGIQFSAWYQPESMNTRYGEALNNYLTISAERGIFALTCYLALLLTPLCLASRFARQEQNFIMLGVCSGIVTYAVSAFFTNSLGFWHVSLVAVTLWFVLVYYTIKNWFQTKQSLAWRMALFPAVISLALSALILGAGSWLLAALPTRVRLFTFNETRQSQNGAFVYPQHQSSIGIILYFHGEGESILDTAKDTLRPMAEAGFTVVSLDYRLRGRDGLNDACALLNWVSHQPKFQREPIFLFGSGLGGRISILVACRQKEETLKAVTAVDADLEWPFPELSPLSQVSQLPVPLLLLYCKNDDLATSALQKFLRSANQHDKNVQLIITGKDTSLCPSTLKKALIFFIDYRK